MSKFKVGDKGIRLNPYSGGKYEAEVVAIVPNGIVITYDVGGQIYSEVLPADGGSNRGGTYFELHLKEAKHISYLFADGTATPFRPVDIRVDVTKPFVAIVTAIKTDKGFTKHQLQRVDETEEELNELFEKEARQPVEEKSERAKVDDNIMNALFGVNWEDDLASALASGKVVFGRGHTR